MPAFWCATVEKQNRRRPSEQMDLSANLSPVIQALLATTGTWLLTALGAAVVLFTRQVSRRYLDASLGFAAGVMIAAGFWSLLAPSIDQAESLGYGSLCWVSALVGFVLGATSMCIMDRVVPHMHPDMITVEGVHTVWQRATLLVLAIGMDNSPVSWSHSPVCLAPGL